MEAKTNEGVFDGLKEGSEEHENKKKELRAEFEELEKKAIEENNEKAELKKNEGNLFLQQKKYEDAIASYNEAIILNPNSPIYYANR